MHSARWICVALGAVSAMAMATSIPRHQLLDGVPQFGPETGKFVLSLMKEQAVPGLALALISDGKVVFSGAYGMRDVKNAQELKPDTVMYGASLTKATFAYFVMQLVDEGKLDLDRPIAAYLPRPLPDFGPYSDLEEDERWRKLTMRMLMSHTTGFANFRFLEPGRKLRFRRDPGTRYGYSGEGIMLAQFVIERGLKLDVGKEMQRRIFDRFGMKRTSMRWRDDFAANVAQGYDENGKLVPHDRRDDVRAAGSLDTTLDDWAAFLAAVARGDGLSKKARAEMIGRHIEIDSETQFPTIQEARTDRWKSIGLGYGIGWGVFETRYGRAFFKEGHDDGTANYALCIAEKKACILMLSNSVRAERIFMELITRLMGGEVPVPYRWEGYAPPRQ